MEREIDRAASELMATVVDVMMIADMVVSFIMEAGWNDRRAAALKEKWGVPCVTGWTALRDALRHIGMTRFVAVSPYPTALQALASSFFAREGFDMVDGATLDVPNMLTFRMSAVRLTEWTVRTPVGAILAGRWAGYDFNSWVGGWQGGCDHGRGERHHRAARAGALPAFHLSLARR